MGVSQFRLGKKHREDGEAYMSHRSRRYDSKHAQDSYDSGFGEGKPKQVEVQCLFCPSTLWSGIRANMPKREICPNCGTAVDVKAAFNKTNCGTTVGNNKTGHKLPASSTR